MKELPTSTVCMSILILMVSLHVHSKLQPLQLRGILCKCRGYGTLGEININRKKKKLQMGGAKKRKEKSYW